MQVPSSTRRVAEAAISRPGSGSGSVRAVSPGTGVWWPDQMPPGDGDVVAGPDAAEARFLDEAGLGLHLREGQRHPVRAEDPEVQMKAH